MPSDAAASILSFIEQARQRFQPQQPETFWNCEALFGNLARSDFLHQAVREELGRLADNADYSGAWHAHEWVLHKHGPFVLSVSLHEQAQRYIHALPYLGMYLPLHAPLTGQRHRLPAAYRNDVFDPQLRLGPAETFRIEAGEVFQLHSAEWAYDLSIDTPQVLLKFFTTPVRMLEWLFNRDTLQAWQANDADLSFTQLRVAADILGKFAHQSSLPALQQLTRYPHHSVRWAAVQSLGRLSRREALEALQRAVKDPHPHVSRAAQKTLASLQARS